jgi:2-furoate---CoA ligase
MLDLGRSFLAAVERSPSACAVVEGDLKLTYAQWFERIRAVAGGLEELGLSRGDRLLVILQNRWQMATLHWACQFAGITATPLNWRAKPDEVDFCIENAEPKAVVFEAASAAAVAGAPRAAQLPRIGVGAVDGVTLDFDALLKSAPPGTLLKADAEDISLMLYTSGTTGKPKGVPRRHRAERAAAVAHVSQNLYRRGECTLGVMPLYHTMGVRSLLAMALIDGCFVCIPHWDAELALKAVETERVTNLYLVPTLYHNLLAHPGFSKQRVASVEKLGFAGAPMSDGLLKRVQAAFEPKLFVNHYGSSEVYTFTIDQDAIKKPGSAGRAGLNQRIRVVKLDAQGPEDLAPAGQEGQIIADLNGDESFEGYWKRPDANAKSLRDGWYFSGDTGYFDADGDLFVTGRVDDMIITGGENVSPVEIESLLSLHPGVDEVAVVGLPDEQWGQRITAFIRRRDTVSAEALDDYCRTSELANFKRPRQYVFVQEIPKSPVGKILRRKLVAGDYQPETDPQVKETL